MADEAPAAPAAETQEEPEKKGGKPSFALKVYAPFKVYYESDAYSVSAINETGPFDVLPHHHKFLCMLVPCTLQIEAPGGPQSIKLNRALMHVKGDSVVVFVDV